MVANLRADNIDGFLAPDNICQRAIYDGVGFLHILSKKSGTDIPAAACGKREFITTSPNSFAALTERSWMPPPSFESRKPQADRGGDRAGELYQCPVTVLEQVLTGPMRTDLAASKPTPSASISIRSLAILRGLDADPDEALGQIKGDVDYKSVPNRFTSRPIRPRS